MTMAQAAAPAASDGSQSAASRAAKRGRNGDGATQGESAAPNTAAGGSAAPPSALLQDLLRDHLFLRQEVAAVCQPLSLVVLFRAAEHKLAMKRFASDYFEKTPPPQTDGQGRKTYPPHPYGFRKVHLLAAWARGTIFSICSNVRSSSTPCRPTRTTRSYRGAATEHLPIHRACSWRLGTTKTSTGRPYPSAPCLSRRHPRTSFRQLCAATPTTSTRRDACRTWEKSLSDSTSRRRGRATFFVRLATEQLGRLAPPSCGTTRAVSPCFHHRNEHTVARRRLPVE